MEEQAVAAVYILSIAGGVVYSFLWAVAVFYWAVVFVMGGWKA